MRKRLGRLAAWLVTLGILAYLFTKAPPREVLGALHLARAWTLPVLAFLVLPIYLADAFAMWRTFGWFLARLSFRQILVVRGATYLLAMINYSVGQGAIVYFVHRTRGVPVLRTTGAVLLIMGINIVLLLLLASVGLAVAPEAPPGLRTLVIAGYAGLAFYTLVAWWKPRFLASRPLFEVLLSAGLRGHLKALVVRVPHLASLVLFTYTALRAFGVHVPLEQAVLYLPLIYLVAVLPISVSGIGPTEGLMVKFFAPYAAGDHPVAVVVAASLVAKMVSLAVQALVGVVCLKSELARDLPRAPVEASSVTGS